MLKHSLQSEINHMVTPTTASHNGTLTGLYGNETVICQFIVTLLTLLVRFKDTIILLELIIWL